MTETIEAASAAAPEKKPPRFALLIATGFGLGYLPIAPGTWGSLGGILIMVLLWRFPVLPQVFLGLGVDLPTGVDNPQLALYLMLTAFFFLCSSLVLFPVSCVGVWAASRVAHHTALKDPQFVVIDEVSGQLTTFLGLAPIPNLIPWYSFSINWKYILVGFILFRVFDIWKPFGVKQAEKLPGGWGIMADDWVAGIYAAICLWGMRAAGF
ncbi:MAG: phosphatidylglycerophosphatase A [Acidobacteria bacterium]|nr:phosphatidylglycerophosphatase A [Acidobacteriota bacterium]